jgi:hypothetical protein
MNIYELIMQLQTGTSNDWDALRDYITRMRSQTLKACVEWSEMSRENELMYRLLKASDEFSNYL